MSGAASSIPVIFCIDSEPDKANPERGEATPWALLERCFERLGAYRASLTEATGAHAAFTWAVRADTQVRELYGEAGWGLRVYGSTWRELMARGDDVGLHPHPQRWSTAAQAWVGAQNEPHWDVLMLREAHAAYVEALGAAPFTLRYGNRYMSQALADDAERLGFRYDLTLEPGYGGRSGALPEHRLPGCCPDYFCVPRTPYRARAGDYRTPDPARAAGLWWIPMSTAVISPRAPRACGPYFRAVSPRQHAYEVLHPTIGPQAFATAIDHVLGELTQPYLALVIRCDMIDRPEVWANLEHLRRHALAHRFEFATPARAMAELVGTRAAA